MREAPGGTGDAAPFAMMSKKRQIARTMNRALKNLIGAMPRIPYLTRRRRTPIAAYTLGSIGLALASGVAGLMWFSPRARSRALVAAKDTYGKVNEKLVHRRAKGNGQVERVEPPTTGV